MRPNWEGVYPAVTTKFFKDQTLDIEGYKRGIKIQMDAGVHGIVTCGSLGENNVLSSEEKIKLLEATIEVVNGKLPIIMTVAECITSEAINFVKKCSSVGADGYMILYPMRYPSDTRETLHYMHKVADASQKPSMIYNNPIAYKTFIDLDMFEDLGKNPLYESTKESTGDIRYMTDIINRFGDRFKIMSGVDDLAFESLVMGADGWIAGLVDAFPRETVVIYELIKVGRIKEARDIYRWFFPLLHLDVGGKFVHNIKLVEDVVGTGTEWMREPRLQLVGEERAAVLKVVNDALACRPTLPQI